MFKVARFGGKQYKKLRDVLGLLRDAYCRHVGVEYTHILEPEQQQWLQERIEVKHDKPTVAEQKYILSKLNAAEAFETFLQTKYVGQKRFSLEGAEAVIPMMDSAIDQAAEHGLDEVVIGMPHRGRLNVLANIVASPTRRSSASSRATSTRRSPRLGRREIPPRLQRRYFQMFGDNDIEVSLTANPPCIWSRRSGARGLVRDQAGRPELRERYRRRRRRRTFTVMPLMLHGDAAFAGQGVVAETLNLALLQGYRTGGTIHIVVNNQIGFTTTARLRSGVLHRCREDDRRTDLPRERRRSGGVRLGARLAVDFRQEFKKDVVIDMLCYRRRGHNEGDDPSMTQPYMYDVIDTKRGVRKAYTEAPSGVATSP